MNPSKAASIASAALKLPASQQASFLAHECVGDAQLLKQVQALLETQGPVDLVQATNESDDPNATQDIQEREVTSPKRAITPASPSTPGEGPGKMIGPYKLLQLIGEGGFGSVFMAEQTEPVQRRVALKIIKLGMDTKQVIARFEVERQALAMMDHPNIAKVLDAGSTEEGRPFFAMELVRGVTLTEYCDTHNLSVRKRLELFLDVCHALQHAHQKGIIHRDLKPGNVLVTLHDTRPVPKVIDFGIAKATHQRLTEKTLFTEYHQFIGTPQYMSPEQAEMSGLDVDTRSDIYSLGVMLYELLAGSTPIEAKSLMTAGIAEIPRIIREEEAPRLSTKFTGQGESQSKIAKCRGVDPERLKQSLRGELDWIVSKALEKDRTRRYETANAFAKDIENYLQNQPVNAGPPSSFYRMRKFARRNKVAVLTTTLITISIFVGLTLATAGWVKANRQLARSNEIVEFLRELHLGMLKSEKQDQASADKLLARCKELFGNDHSAIGSLLATRAAILSTSGQLEEALEVLEKCLEFQRKSLGPRHELVASSLKLKGEIYSREGKVDQAIEYFDQALSIQKECFGLNSIQVGETTRLLLTMKVVKGKPELHDEIQSLYQQAIHCYESKQGKDAVPSLQLKCGYGNWLQVTGKLEEARIVLEEAIPLARPHSQYLGDTWFLGLNSLTVVYITLGETKLAKVHYEELLDIMRNIQVGGTAIISQLDRYARWLKSVEEISAMEEILQEARTIAFRDLPAGHDVREQVLRHLLKYYRDTNLPGKYKASFDEWFIEVKASGQVKKEAATKYLRDHENWLKEEGLDIETDEIGKQIKSLLESS